MCEVLCAINMREINSHNEYVQGIMRNKYALSVMR